MEPEPICHLTHLSLEIQNLIASFLDYETEEEFILRTQTRKEAITTKGNCHSAVSSSGIMVATIMRDKNNYIMDDDYKYPSFNNNFIIQDLKNNRTATFKSASTLGRINAFEFNKQGTCFIIRGGKDSINEKDVSCYQLFSLKDPTKDISKNKMDPIKNKLQHYLIEKRVCKSITSGS